MNSNANRGNSAKKNKLPKKTQAKGNLSRKNLRAQQCDKWCADICQGADGAATTIGLKTLGPINSFSDILLQTGANDPRSILAAEQLVHLVEGWRYAAAATNALLSNATGPATHFAYYAELRAAISLFAWSGIRVKQDAHYYIDPTGKQIHLGFQPTHNAVWGIWKYWSQRNDARALLHDHIKLHPAITLGEVIKSVRYVSPGTALQDWGIDLWDATRDHLARNTVSYEANFIATPLTRMDEPDAKLILDLWNLFLSDGSALVFDSALANYVVHEAIPKLQIEAAGTRMIPTYELQLSDIATSIAAETGVSEQEISRRLDPSKYPAKPFSLASNSSTTVHNVLCRSFFLLRMAMLAAKLNMDVAKNPAAQRWMENWLEHAGILDPSGAIAIYDIEEDYRVAVEDFSLHPPYPASVWADENLSKSARLTRPDACLAWTLAI